MALRIDFRASGPGEARIDIAGVEDLPDELEIAVQRGSDEYHIGTDAAWQVEKQWHRLQRRSEDPPAGFLAGWEIVDALAEASYANNFLAEVRWAGGTGVTVLRIREELIASTARQEEVAPEPPPVPIEMDPRIVPISDIAPIPEPRKKEIARVAPNAPSTPPPAAKPEPAKPYFRPWMIGLAALLPVLLFAAWFFGPSDSPPEETDGAALTGTETGKQENGELPDQAGQDPNALDQPVQTPSDETQEADLALEPEQKVETEPPPDPVLEPEAEPAFAAEQGLELELEPEFAAEQGPQLVSESAVEPSPETSMETELEPLLGTHPQPDASGLAYVEQVIAKTQDATAYIEHAKRRAQNGDCDAVHLLYDEAAKADPEIAGKVARLFDPQDFTQSPCIDRPSEANAHTYYELAANGQIPHAQRRYGQLLVERYPSGPTYKEGMDWLRQAADAGDPEARRILQNYRTFENR